VISVRPEVKVCVEKSMSANLMCHHKASHSNTLEDFLEVLLLHIVQ